MLSKGIKLFIYVGEKEAKLCTISLKILIKKWSGVARGCHLSDIVLRK